MDTGMRYCQAVEHMSLVFGSVFGNRKEVKNER